MSKVPANVYAIDCDDYNTKYDTPKGHSYFLDDDGGKAGVVFNDIYRAVFAGRVWGDDENQRTFVL